jgi:hypothetical protein
MRHAADRDLILAADGELHPLRLAELRKHLDICTECRERDEELRAGSAEFANLQHDIILPPAGVARARLLTALHGRPDGRLHSHEKPWLMPLGFALAAMLGLVLFIANRGPGDLSEPKNALTPGETRAITIGDVCRSEIGGRGDEREIIPPSVQQKVFREYGIANARPSAYEVDYLITPELGGADSIRNLWPQPYSTMWNAHVKDDLEDRLHEMVCEGKLDLRTAQRDIATDWIAAYKKYFHTDRPLQNPS